MTILSEGGGADLIIKVTKVLLLIKILLFWVVLIV